MGQRNGEPVEVDVYGRADGRADWQTGGTGGRTGVRTDGMRCRKKTTM